MSPKPKKAKPKPKPLSSSTPKRGVSKYDPSFPEALIKHSGKLYGTLTRFAAKIGVHVDTLEDWARKYPEFKEAKLVAKTRQEAVMEKLGLKGMIGRHQSFHVAGWIFYMKARFGWNDAGPNDQDDTDLEFET